MKASYILDTGNEAHVRYNKDSASLNNLKYTQKTEANIFFYKEVILFLMHLKRLYLEDEWV